MMLHNLFAKRPPQLFIPARQTVGGPATFLRNLKTYLDAAEYPYTAEYRRGDSIFFPIRHRTKVLDRVKKHGGQVIQRLDGAYGDDQPARRDRLADVYHNYADWVIYQSQWCKRVCDERMGERRSPQYRIIPNGVNGRVFYPGDKSRAGGEAVENYPQFRATALIHANDYPFTACGDAYREVFDLATARR